MSKQSDLVSVSQGASGDPLFIDTANNRVGVGTSSPLRKLDVVSGSTTEAVIRSTSTSEVALRLQNSTTGTGDTDGIYLGRTVDGRNFLWTYENNPWVFGTNNAERMRITDAGSVGIGTSSPVGNLNINDGSGGIIAATRTSGATSGNLGTLRFGNTNVDSNLANITAIQDGSTTSSAIIFETQPTGGSTVERMRIDAAGRVTMPYQPAFVAFMSANHTTTSSGQLPFDSLSSEIPSQRSTGYSTANRRFTAPVTGLYQFSVSLDFAGNYSNYYFWCGINGGGRYKDFLENVDILANGGFYSTFSIHMTAGDYIQLHSGVAGINLYGGNAAWNCAWQGHLLG